MRDHHDVLSAQALGKIDRLALKRIQPPEEAVTRAVSLLCGIADPGRRHDLSPLPLPVVQVKVTEFRHVPRSQIHLRATAVIALSILVPPMDRDSNRVEQGLPGERERVRAAGLHQYRRKQVSQRRAVVPPGARLRHQL